MQHDQIDLDPTCAEQEELTIATNVAELDDQDLGQVSGGCRKAGGDQLELKGYQPIIAI